MTGQRLVSESDATRLTAVDLMASRLPLLLQLAGSFAAVVGGCVGANKGSQAQIGRWGLIQALPVSFFACVVALTVAFLVELSRGKRSNTRLLLAQVVGMVVLLHGAPSLLEQEPRFATAWLHVGFIDQILDRGVSAPTVDARFSWPGFFGAAAAVTGAGGLSSALPLLRWAPVVMVLAYLPSIYVIGTHLTGSRTATWLGLWLFLLANWVGQDYLAPQSLSYVLFLALVAVMITFFRGGRRAHPGSRPAAWRERFSTDGSADLAADRGVQVLLVVLLVLIQTALSMTHQLTPIMVVLVSALLVLVGRCRLLSYPIIAGVLTFGWISVGAEAYWLGHLDTIFGGVGDVDAVVDNAVGDRIAGSATHLAIVHLRLVYTGVIWALGAGAAATLWIKGRPPLTLIALSVAPFLTLIQNYGSEGVLRIFLFSVPFACLLIAQALVAVTHWHGWAQLLVGGFLVALIPVFLVTRYGNESFEQVRPGEVAAIQTLYRLAPQGSALVSPTSQLPWRFAYATDYRYERPTDAAGFRRGDLGAIRNPYRSRLHPERRTYVIITTSQIVYAHEALGEPADWFAQVRPLLTPENGYRLLFRNANALIYEYRRPS